MCFVSSLYASFWVKRCSAFEDWCPFTLITFLGRFNTVKLYQIFTCIYWIFIKWIDSLDFWSKIRILNVAKVYFVKILSSLCLSSFEFISITLFTLKYLNSIPSRTVLSLSKFKCLLQRQVVEKLLRKSIT